MKVIRIIKSSPPPPQKKLYYHNYLYNIFTNNRQSCPYLTCFLSSPATRLKFNKSFTAAARSLSMKMLSFITCTYIRSHSKL